MAVIKLNRRGALMLTLTALLVVIIVLGVVLGVRSCSGGQPRGVAADSTDTIATVEEVSFEADQIVPFEGEVTVGAGYHSYLEDIILGCGSNMLYGLPTTEYEIEASEIANGETFSKLMNNRYEVNIAVVNELIDKSKGVFDMRDLRVGNSYTAFLSQDTTTTSGRLQYLVYEKSRSEYIVFGTGDSVFVRKEKKNVITEERYAEGVINSSLHATMYENGLNPQLANRLDAIYKWTIDFYTLQKGDKFRVIYEEQFIDTVSVGIGKIYGAEFTHNGKPIMAVRFEQGDEIGYWDATGKNLRRNFLVSPLSFSARVSSKFGMRVHPIKRVRRQHNGVDYAAPSGTSVRSVADGVVIRKGWDRGGGGNTLWVKHSQGIESGYLHLRGYAKGISVGSRVRQEQVIAYVGSTGASTGPHLDFRIKQSGKYIDPLKTPSTPTNPIAAGNKATFNQMLADVQGVMNEYAH